VIRQAALYLAAPDDVRSAGLVVAGHPVAFRVIVAVVRAGAGRVLVPAALRSTELERALAGSPRARRAVAWLDGPAALADEPTLLVPAATLTPADALASLAGAPGAARLAESPGDAPVFVADRALVLALRGPVAAGVPLAGPLDETRRLRDLPVVATGRWHVRVTDAAAAAQAEARLYGELGSPIDTRLDRAVHRRLSRPISRAAVAAGVSANAITIASGVVGLAAAAAFARGDEATVMGGLLLYLLAVVLDHADGEVARLTLAESALGEWLDLVVDTVVHGALLLALGLAVARVTGHGLTAGVVGAAGVVVGGLLGKVWPPPPPGQPGRGLLDRLTSRDGFYAMLATFVVVRLTAPVLLPALLVMIAAGAHAYWLARTVLLLSRKTRRNPK
jgi:hypothetical protein